MDLDDILEVIGTILVAICGVLLVALAVVSLVYCFFGWIFAVIAFFHGKVVLGIALLIVWMLASGARLRW